MVLKVYIKHTSLPATTVLMTAELLGLELDKRLLLTSMDEPITPEYEMKENSEACVIPVLDDDDFVLWDSHAINAYLVSKYGKDDSLYPKDIKMKAVVDQRLHFDSNLYANLVEIFRPVMVNAEKEILVEKKNYINDVYRILNTFLKDSQWLAGENMTIADVHLIATTTIADAFVPINPYVYSNLTKWFARMQGLRVFEVARNGLYYIERKAAAFNSR